MILDRILRDKKIHLDRLNLDIEELKKEILKAPKPKDFYSALKFGKISIIGEVKKASPSKGVLRENFNPLELGLAYEGAVQAISVLTEEDHFQGSISYLKTVSTNTNTPTLCKDFIFTPEQVYLARSVGASSLLLIARILDDKKLKELLELSRSLGMEPLIEAHTKEEVDRVVKAGGKILGINNRDLSTFEVDIRRSIELTRGLPEDMVLVAESGIQFREDIALLEENGINAVLIGETFVKSPNPIIETARYLRGKVTEVKICGITREDEIEILNRTKPHYMGFIFAPSKRRVSIDKARSLKSLLNPSIKSVGVFVNPTIEEVLSVAKELNLDIVQLHGSETLEFCKELLDLKKFKVWKALKGDLLDLETMKNYQEVTHKILLDSSNPGHGKPFDWKKIQGLTNFILAGGVNIDNIKEGLSLSKPDIIDVSSGVEVSIKDEEGNDINKKDYIKVLEFIEEVRRNG